MSDLILIDLELTDFKSFIGEHHFELDRPPGLYYITGTNKLAPGLGANGIGKTALTADALMWVLWNKTERDLRPADSIKPWDTPKAKTSISLRFKRSGKVQIIRRTRKPNSLALIHAKSGDSRMIEQKDVASIIGMSEEMFRRTVVLGQFGSLFLDLRPEEQSRLFNEALDLDIWLKASEIASQNGKAASQGIPRLEAELARLEGAEAILGDQAKQAEAKAAEWKEARTGEIAQLEADIARIKKTLFQSYKTLQDTANAYDGPRPGPAALVDLMSRQRATWKDLNQKLADARSEIRTLTTQEATLKAQLKELNASLKGDLTCPECSQKVSKSHLIDKAGKTQAALDRVIVSLKKKNDLRDLESLIVASERLGDLYRSKEIVSGQLEGHIKSKRERLNQLASQDQNPFTAALTEIKKKLSSNAKARKGMTAEIAEAEVRRQACDFWRDGYKEIRLSLIDAALEELQLAATRHAEMLGLEDWLIRFDTERLTQAGSLAPNFTIRLWPPGQDEAIRFESYSGGESQRLQLAIAFGLSEVILSRAGVSPSLEILDEPSKGLSSEGVKDLLEHLAERAKELGRAIYIVEHHSLEKGCFTKTILIEKDENGSRIIEA
jgi:DNA repair exonuclease SbcCD ATPase subunit